MAKHISFVFLVSVFYCVYGDEVPLPSYITPCKQKDPHLNECIKVQVEKAKGYFKAGLKSHNVPPLDPLHLDKPIELKNKGFDLTIKDVSVYGLGDSKILDVKFSIEKSIFRLELITDIKLTGQYNIDGKVLFVPIKGHGDAVINAYGTHIDITCELGVLKTDNGDVFTLKSPEFKYDIKKTHFDFDNLFDGNKAVAEPTLKFMNEKSADIMADVAPPAIKQIVHEAVSGVAEFMKRTPITKMLPE